MNRRHSPTHTRKARDDPEKLERSHTKPGGKLQPVIPKMEPRNTIHTIPQKHRWFQWTKEDSRCELAHFIGQAEKPKTSRIHRKNGGARATLESKLLPYNKRKEHGAACTTPAILFSSLTHLNSLGIVDLLFA